jgi:hypothetical protein
MPQVVVAVEPTMVKPIILVALAVVPGQEPVVPDIAADMVAQVEPTVVVVVVRATTTAEPVQVQEVYQLSPTYLLHNVLQVAQ